MELWMWILAAALAAGALIVGWFVGRTTGDDAEKTRAKSKVLEAELNSIKDEYSQYRDDVTGHFRTTADLVHQMTSSYKAVYEHLASGSEKLCSGEVMLELDEAPRLSSSARREEKKGNGSAESSADEPGEPAAASPEAKPGETGSEEQRTFH